MSSGVLGPLEIEKEGIQCCVYYFGRLVGLPQAPLCELSRFRADLVPRRQLFYRRISVRGIGFLVGLSPAQPADTVQHVVRFVGRSRAPPDEGEYFGECGRFSGWFVVRRKTGREKLMSGLWSYLGLGPLFLVLRCMVAHDRLTRVELTVSRKGYDKFVSRAHHATS